MKGRMGFEQLAGGTGSSIDFRSDLGLGSNELSWRVRGSVRPLEHHVLRVYGSIPERYTGSKVLTRDLQTRTRLYQAGTEIESVFETATLGAGYDLDLLAGATFFGGFHGDMRYMTSQVSFAPAPRRDLDEVISIHELVPCLGVHGELTSLFPFSRLGRAPGLGGFGRLTFSMTPNFVNYVDLNLGLSLRIQFAAGPILEVRGGYEHESFYHGEERISGKLLEYSRDGISFSLGAAF
ncbi:MAG: hypothetical protein FJ118_03465 [Deltaproteobacteria bacterium]|nr:hypothetical protein [Deltaproteobacteria bacterium]